MYTFENLCREDISIALGDEAVKIIHNTKGRVGEISDELKDLLRYMDGAAPDNAYTRELDSAVELVRTDEKWSREYMVLNELMRDRERIGKRIMRVSQVRNSRNTLDAKVLAGILMIHPNTYQAILDTMDAHPDWDDEKIAETIDFE